MSSEHKEDNFTRGTASLVAISVIILVGSEVIGVAAATAWALGGLLQLGSIMTWSIGTVLCGAGAYLTYRFGRNVWLVEKTALARTAIPSEAVRSEE
jgi:amino acid transporter